MIDFEQARAQWGGAAQEQYVNWFVDALRSHSSNPKQNPKPQNPKFLIGKFK